MSEVLVNIHIEELEEGGYLATSDSIQGLVAQGRTIAETLEIARDVARKLVESYIEHGDPLPVSASRKPKRFVHDLEIPVAVG
jgi:predicted RNase H-like HicB family nuclease